MYGSSDYHNRQQGWDTSASDYHSHVLRIARTPTVLTDVPHYPNVHKIFSRSKVAYEEEKGNRNQQQQQQQQQQQLQRPETPAAELRKKVHFVEEKVVEVVKDRDESEVVGRSVDAEVEGFLQQRRKNFELCKWATFKP